MACVFCIFNGSSMRIFELLEFGIRSLLLTCQLTFLQLKGSVGLVFVAAATVVAVILLVPFVIAE